MLRQLVRNRQHGFSQAIVVAGQEPEQGRQQQGRIQRVGLVVLAQDAPLADTVLEDVRADLIGDSLPVLLELRIAADLGQLRRAVERDPAHELRRDVVLRRAACLPDALVGLSPHTDRAFRLRLDDRPQPSGRRLLRRVCSRIESSAGAEDVVLPLVEGAVADAHRTGACIAGEVIQRRLRQVTASVDPVHDLQRAVLVRPRRPRRTA